MKYVTILPALAAVLLVATPAVADVYASGVVKEIELREEFVDQGGGYNNQLSVRIEGACIDSGPGGSYDPPIAVGNNGSILIRSGRMDAPYVHNAAKFQSAVDILMSSLEKGLEVTISGLPDCEEGDDKTINLWAARIGIKAK
jgi:hypothetical protein